MRPLFSIPFFVLLFLFNPAYSQKEADNWFFGYGAGLSFTNGTPQVVGGGMTFSPEGTSCISDENGDLLFYTDGMVLYDRRHQAMPNGMGLIGDTISSQSALIVRQPGSKFLFYVFTVGSLENNNPTLAYSIVDIRLNNGFGDVVATEKNKVLNSNSCEKVTAIKHENANDLWIVAHTFNTNEFLVYYLNCRGLNEVPLTQNIGQVVDGQIGNAIGYIKGSPDGRKLAVAHFRGTAEVFDFNNRTGTISNGLELGSNPGKVCQSYGLEFSPDSKLLYVSSMFNCGGPGGYEIAQYDLNDADINGSRYIVNGGLGNPAGSIQLARDKKLYVALAFSSALGCINSPNIYGAGCNFVISQVGLSKMVGPGLPNTTSGFLRTLLGEDTSICKPFDYRLSLNITGATYNWDDGSQQSSRNFNTAGKYWLQITTSEGCEYSDTVYITERQLPGVSIGKDTGTCSGIIDLVLKPNVAGASYLWQDGTTLDSLEVNTPGTYWVEANANGCIARDTINVQQYTPTPFSLGGDTAVCDASLALTTGVAYPKYLWNTGNTSQKISVSTSGTYWCEATNSKGCSYRDSIDIQFKVAPTVFLGKDTVLCAGNMLLLDAKSSGDSYLWQNKSVENSFLVEEPGVYFVEVQKDGCTSADTITIAYKTAPAPSLGKDLEICPGQSLQVSAGTNADWYKWSDGSVTNVIQIETEGTFVLQAGNQCGVGQDEIVVKEGSCKLKMPNAFTPSKIGNNSFKISNGFGLRDFALQIYNRWGQLIFKTNDPLSGWNGYAGGVLQEAGTYIYVVAYSDPRTNNKQASKGTFLLIR